MKLINGLPTDLEAKDGEMISVQINGVQCPPNVNLSLDGSPWTGGSFKVLRASHPNGRHLLVQINCGPVGPGTTFTIVVTGDASIDPLTETSTFPVACRQGPVRQVSYTVDVA
jgi:hypothetical protein